MTALNQIPIKSSELGILGRWGHPQSATVQVRLLDKIHLHLNSLLAKMKWPRRDLDLLSVRPSTNWETD